MTGLVIVGGSYAGQNVAEAARAHGYDGKITLLTEERHLPYHRPPLSKGYVSGETDASRLPLRSEQFYADRAIDVLFQTSAQSIDVRGYVETNSGSIAFDTLAITTGMRARPIDAPGAKLDGVLSLRSQDDAETIRARLPSVSAAVIIGAGYIGLELAASLSKLGISVTVIEAQDRVLARVTNPFMSSIVAAEHRAHGVELRLGLGVTGFEGSGGRVTGVRTSDGALHVADLVIVAIGALPNVEFAAHLGLANSVGIEVDQFGRTRAPNIFAAGDCTHHPCHHAGARLRVESVQNAIDQGKAVGAALSGRQQPHTKLPWFWSDQYDMKLQTAGILHGADTEIVRGAPEEKRFSIYYLKGERIIAVDSVNAPADHMLARKILASPHTAKPEQLRDNQFDLRTLLA